MAKKNNINWDKIKEDFLTQREEGKPNTYLREKLGWTMTKINSGNTAKKITGWGAEWDEIQHNILSEKIKELEKAEAKRTPYILANEMNAVDELVKKLKPYKAVKIAREIVKTKNSDGSETTKSSPVKIEYDVYPSAGDIKIIWEILRTIQGKIIRVIKNQNIEDVSDDVKEYREDLRKTLEKIQNANISKRTTNK